MRTLIVLLCVAVVILSISLGYQTIKVKHSGNHCGENSICVGIPNGIDTLNSENFGNNWFDKCIGVKILRRKDFCTGG